MEKFLATLGFSTELLISALPAAEKRRVTARAASGEPMVLCGTHALIQENAEYAKLGLVITDEQHRFGVNQRKILSKKGENPNVLVMTATPIPRTLQMSLVGIRSLSLIETAPVNRYPVQTYVIEENKQIIRDAIYKELSRNGQMFILYNKVASIESKMQQLHKLVPEARITIAHGQMSKKELEKTIAEIQKKMQKV